MAGAGAGSGMLWQGCNARCCRARQRVGLEILADRPKDCCEVRASRPQSRLRATAGLVAEPKLLYS